MINISIARKIFATIGLLAGIYAPTHAQTPESAAQNSKKEKQQQRKQRIDQMIRQEEEGTLIYQKQNLFAFKLYSDGWAVMFEKGFMKTVNRTTLFSVELGNRKDQKEYRLSKVDNAGFSIGNALVYGKQNNFFFAKMGIGQSYLMGGKGNKNGVAVSAVYNGGLSIGLLKPYYVDARNTATNTVEAIKWLGDGSENDTRFLDPSALEGNSGLFKGFGEMKIKPGVFAKGALRFDYGRYNELISAVEAGINLEYYASDMPIMAKNDPKKLFANVFIAIEFGRRK